LGVGALTYLPVLEVGAVTDLPVLEVGDATDPTLCSRSLCSRSLPLIQILKCAADAQGQFSSQEA